MCLRFTFLLIMRVASWLRLSQREETWKTAEILILRHQLAVLQHRPHRSLHAAAPLKPLPEPINLDHYRVQKQARVGGLINEYRLVA